MRRIPKKRNSVYCESYQIIDDIDVLPQQEKEVKFKQTISSLTQENKRLKELVHFKEHTLDPKQNIANKNSDYHPKLGMESSQNNHHNGRQYKDPQVSTFQSNETNVYVTGTMKSIVRQIKKQLRETDLVKSSKQEYASIKNVAAGSNAEFVEEMVSRESRDQNQNYLDERERQREREYSVSQQTKTPQPSCQTLKQLIANHFKQIFKGKTEIQIENHCQHIMQEIKKQTKVMSSLHNFNKNSQRDLTQNINVQEQLDSRTSFNNMQTPKKSSRMLSSNKSENTIEMMNSHINSSSSDNLNFDLNQEIVIQVQNFVQMIKKNAQTKSKANKSQESSLNRENNSKARRQMQREGNQASQDKESRQSSGNQLKYKYSEGSQQGQIGDLNIQTSLKKIEQSLKNCKAQVINDKQNQEFLPKQSNLKSNIQSKSRKHGHFRGSSYIDKQPVQLKYREDEVIVRKYYNNSCLSTPFQGVSKFEQSQFREMQKKHPIQPNTEWSITPQNRVYTEKWKVIVDKSMNPVAVRNNLIRNSPYV